MYFYFPRIGRFTGAPVSCHCRKSKSGDHEAAGNVTTSGKAITYNVVAQLTKREILTFRDVLAEGRQAVLDFLQTKNITEGEMGFRWSLLTPYLFGSKDFFKDVVLILKRRGTFEETVWHYAFYHGEVDL